jgi:hypothetical protein
MDGFDLRSGSPASGTFRAVEGSKRTFGFTGAAALSSALVLFAAGCGGTRQDADEPSGMFKVDVVKASFEPKQRLADSSVMKIVVRNADTRTIPDISVTVTNDDDAKGGPGFTTRSSAPDLSDPTRPLWIVDRGPTGADTAYVSTWALGPLPKGAERTFEWHVTPIAPGTHTLRWHVDAGLNGKAKAQTASGEDPVGTFRVSVSSKPAQVTVDPKTGDVVNAGDASS